MKTEFTIFTADGVTFTEKGANLANALRCARQLVGRRIIFAVVETASIITPAPGEGDCSRRSITFRRRAEMAELDAETFIPRSQNSFRVDQIAEILSVSVNHVIDLIKQGEIVAPKERVDSAPSNASILVPRTSIVRFVKRRRNSPARLTAKTRRRIRRKGAEQ